MGGGGSLGAAHIGIGVAHDPAWVTQLGGPGDDEALAVAASAAGVYVGGSTSSAWFGPFVDACDPNIPPDHVGEDCADAFLTNAETAEGIQFGDPQSDEVKFVTLTSDAVYACGNYREPPTGKYQKDGFVARLAFDLSQKSWEQTIENPGKVDELMGVAVTSDVFVAGGSAAELDGHPTQNEDDVVARLGTDGAMQAIEQLGGQGLDEMMGVAADSDGVYAIGATASWLDDDPGENLGSTDSILLAFDPGLEVANVICRAQMGTSTKDVGQSVIATADAIYVAGYTEGRINGELANGSACNVDDPGGSDEFTVDAFVARYDKSCQHVWTRQFGTTSSDAASVIASDGQLLYVTGFYGSEAEAHGGTTSATHAFLRAYDFDGNVTGEVRFESTNGTDIGQGVAAFGDFVYVVGGTNGTLSNEPSLGQRDAFFAKIPISAVNGNVHFSGDGCQGI